MKNPDNTCNLPHCRNPRQMGYLDKGICYSCFSKYERDELREKLGIKKTPKRKDPVENP